MQQTYAPNVIEVRPPKTHPGFAKYWLFLVPSTREIADLSGLKQFGSYAACRGALRRVLDALSNVYGEFQGSDDIYGALQTDPARFIDLRCYFLEEWRLMVSFRDSAIYEKAFFEQKELLEERNKSALQ